MIRNKIIKALLSYAFYEANNNYITDKHLADKEPIALYKVIKKYYKHHPTDISTTDNLRDIFRVESRGRISESSMAAYMAFIDGMDEVDVAPEICTSLVKELYKQYMMEDAQNLLAAANSDESKGKAALDILNKLYSDVILPEEEEYDSVEFSTEYFKEVVANRYRWVFHHPHLKEYTRGIGDSVFVVVGGTPNTGKTHFCISSVFQPGGFITQGAKVLYFANEEKGAITALRGMASFSGVDKKDLEDTDNGKLTSVLEKFKPYAGKTRIITEKYMDLVELERIIAKEAPDIVVVDMADKVNVSGDFAREDQQLGHLYLKLRDFAKIYSCAVIATSQASAEAEGKKFWTADTLKGSKTAKSAEGDLIITLGKENKEVDDHIRYANIVKNKLSGVHRTVVYRLDPEQSRILV